MSRRLPLNWMISAASQSYDDGEVKASNALVKGCLYLCFMNCFLGCVHQRVGLSGRLLVNSTLGCWNSRNSVAKYAHGQLHVSVRKFW